MTSCVHDHQLRQLRQKIQAVNEDYDQLMEKLAKDSRLCAIVGASSVRARLLHSGVASLEHRSQTFGLSLQSFPFAPPRDFRVASHGGHQQHGSGRGSHGGHAGANRVVDPAGRCRSQQCLEEAKEGAR